MEEPLPAGGSCLLGSINLSAYVDKDGQFDTAEFKKDIQIIVREMNKVLDQGLPLHPLQIQRDTVRDWRQIGIGVMGIADMLIKMGLRYDSDTAISVCDSIGYILANESIKTSALLSLEQGTYPMYNEESVLKSQFLLDNTDDDTYELVEKYGLRNSQILTIAPTGSISTMIGVSGGIEPIFNLSYNRKTESLHGEDVYYKVFTPIAKEYMDKYNIEKEEDLPSYFVTTNNLNPFKRVEMQGKWQSHIDASISSTINLPNSVTVEEVEDLYIHAWKKGLKGMTIFRSGCDRVAILSTDDKKEETKEEVTESTELKRGEWETKPKGCIEVPRKLVSGCGKDTLHITIYPKEKRVIDFYITSSSNGGCKLCTQGLAISMSGMLRGGMTLDNIQKAYRGMGKCPSFTRAREKGIQVSKGSSCPSAILNAVLQVQKDLDNECLFELQELGYYDKKESKMVDLNGNPLELLYAIKEIESVIGKKPMIYGSKESLNRIDKVDSLGTFFEELEKINSKTIKDVTEELKKVEPKFKKEIFTQIEKDFMKEYGETAFAQRFNKCPSCGEPLEHVGGCIQCMNCSYTKCE